MSDYGNDIIVSDVKLPRTVPQDPEAVRNEQEVRQATAEALRAAQVGRGPTPDELANLREIEADLPAISGGLRRPGSDPLRDQQITLLIERVAALEKRLDTLEQEPLADGWPR